MAVRHRWADRTVKYSCLGNKMYAADNRQAGRQAGRQADQGTGKQAYMDVDRQTAAQASKHARTDRQTSRKTPPAS